MPARTALTANTAFLPRPTGLLTLENYMLVKNIFSRVAQGADAEQIWLQYKQTKLPRPVFNRVTWMVDPARMHDVTENVLNGFRSTMLKDQALPPREVTGDLGEDRGREIMDMVLRRAWRRPQLGRPSYITEADQLALMLHGYRLGGSQVAVTQIFRHEPDHYAIRMAGRLARTFYTQSEEGPWGWIDKQRLPMVPKSGYKGPQ